MTEPEGLRLILCTLAKPGWNVYNGELRNGGACPITAPLNCLAENYEEAGIELGLPSPIADAIQEAADTHGSTLRTVLMCVANSSTGRSLFGEGVR